MVNLSYVSLVKLHGPDAGIIYGLDLLFRGGASFVESSDLMLEGYLACCQSLLL
jgi:hypothetical protein